MRPILEVAREAGLGEGDVETLGRYKAKVPLGALEAAPSRAGRLILVSAVSPTPLGEGKTTMSIALAMGLRAIGKRVVLSLREPSLGPIFGIKGGGTGGGRASLEPGTDINLHFTGDLHAISSAHNLLAALVDNAIHQKDDLGGVGVIEPRTVTWPRALDMNDRSLRHCIVGLGGKVDGVPRETSFDITAASEIMAIHALAQGYKDLEERIGRVVIGMSESGKPVTAAHLGGAGAMTALLRDALMPNLVQAADGTPALVHSGPFGNVAHGCSSVLATRLAMKLGDYAVTEAGFGFDLGGEKFLDIKCRSAGLWPRMVVLVATLRALRMHGGASAENAAGGVEALSRGIEHLRHHLESIARFGLPALVVLNAFPDDDAESVALLEKADVGARVVRCDAYARGPEGAVELARAAAELADSTDASPPQPRFLYPLELSLADKVRAVARGAYGAKDVAFAPSAEKQLRKIEAMGYGKLPVCIAKTQLSLTDDPLIKGRPKDFVVQAQAARLSAGAGFVVVRMGEITTMPGLPKVPAARRVRLSEDGRITGLMQNE